MGTGSTKSRDWLCASRDVLAEYSGGIEEERELFKFLIFKGKANRENNLRGVYAWRPFPLPLSSASLRHPINTQRLPRSLFSRSSHVTTPPLQRVVCARRKERHGGRERDSSGDWYDDGWHWWRKRAREQQWRHSVFIAFKLTNFTQSTSVSIVTIRISSKRKLLKYQLDTQ